MRKIFGLAIAFVFLAIPGPAQNSRKGAQGTPQKDLCAAASTQLEMNACSAEEFHKADAQLNVAYGELVKEMQKDIAEAQKQNDSEQKNRNEMRVQKLKTAEKAWLQYRDLHCEAAKYEYEGGSMSPMVWAQCMTTTTEHRVEEFNRAYNSN